MHPYNTQTTSKINRSLVLAQIYRHPMISRVELAKLTGLDRSAITHILNFLLKEGLVEEAKIGAAGSRGGRRPIHLQIRYNAAVLIAIELGLKTLTGVVADLQGHELARDEMDIHRGEPLLDVLIRFLDDLQRRRSSLFQDGVIIGIGSPGVVDNVNGRMLLNFFHDWREIPVKEEIEKRYGKPVFLENDANAAAIGELYQLNAEPGIRSMIYLFIRESLPGTSTPLGVGGAVILDGKLWSGAHSCAGEVSETINDAFTGIMEQLEARQNPNAPLHEPNEGRLKPNANTSVPPIRRPLGALLHDSEQGNPACQWAVEEIAGRLGKLLGDLAVFLDSQSVLVYIHPPDGKEGFLKKIQQSFFRNYRSPMTTAVAFLPPRLGAKAALEGVIRLGLEKIFVPEAGRPSILFP